MTRPDSAPPASDRAARRSPKCRCARSPTEAHGLHGMRGSRPVIGSSTIRTCRDRRQWRGPAWRGRTRRPTAWSPAVRGLSAKIALLQRLRDGGQQNSPAIRPSPAAAASGPAPPAAPPKSAIPDAGFAADRRARAASWRGGTAPASALASSITRPASGFIRPASTFSKVDLPAPLGPSTAMNSPAWACKETSLRMVLPPRVTR